MAEPTSKVTRVTVEGPLGPFVDAFTARSACCWSCRGPLYDCSGLGALFRCPGGGVVVGVRGVNDRSRR